MPLMEHLIELRRRLLIAFAAVALCGIVVFIFYNPVLHFLSGPYQHVTPEHAGLAAPGCKLIVTDPLAPFLVRLKIAGLRRARPVGADRHVADLALHRARAAPAGAALRGRLPAVGDRAVPARVRRGLVHDHEGPVVPARASAATRSGR